MNLDFSDLAEVVTGGTGELGSAVVGRWVAAGAQVHVPVFASEELKHFAFRNHKAVKVQEGLDLKNEQDVERFNDSVESLYASIHITGGFDMAPITETTLESWNRLMTLNATT